MYSQKKENHHHSDINLVTKTQPNKERDSFFEPQAKKRPEKKEGKKLIHRLIKPPFRSKEVLRSEGFLMDS